MGWSRAWLTAVGLSLALAPVAMVVRAQGLAQSDERRTVAGSSERNRGGAVGGKPGEVQHSTEAAAEASLAVALDLLRQGRRLEARRQLELLVARHPDTAVADRAREALQELYAAGDNRAPLTAAGGPQRSSSSGPAPAAGSSLSRSDLPGGQVPAANAQAALIALQDDLRMTAGDRVFFGEGSSELGAHARPVIEGVARWLGRYPTLVVAVEGHADDQPGTIDRVRLSRERAEAVRARLVEAGVRPERLVVRAYSDRNPVALCREAICRAENRRVVMTVVGRLAAGDAAPSDTERAGRLAGEEGGGRRSREGLSGLGARSLVPR